MNNPGRFAVFCLPMVLFALAFACGCSKSPADKKDVVAYVNNEPILKSDLDRELALRKRFDPDFKITPDAQAQQLDIIIDKRLIIQEAMQKGLAREEKFVNTIKTFWEQTLIRDFLDRKRSEYKDLTAGDEEIRKYYDNLSKKITLKVARARNRKLIKEAYDKALKDRDAGTALWQVIGPIGYEDTVSDILLDSFDMPVGEVRLFEDPPEYYAVMVVAKEPVNIEPLDKIQDELKRRVLASKERRLFENWLKSKKKNSSIKVVGP